jgi:hypothetical protein
MAVSINMTCSGCGEQKNHVLVGELRLRRHATGPQVACKHDLGTDTGGRGAPLGGEAIAYSWLWEVARKTCRADSIYRQQ